MSDFPDDIMTTASWVAAHRLDLGKEAGQQIVRLIAHSLSDERAKSAARIAALEAENAGLRRIDGLMAIKRLENCSMFWAKTNDGRWHYLNHADTWQPFQGPESNVRIAALEAENADLRSGEYLVRVIEERERLRKALEPFALISMEGLVSDDVYTTVTTCSAYFHTAATVIREAKP